VKDPVENLDERLVDVVLRALGDPIRRRILELVRDAPGMTIQELTGHFRVSRFAIMKHLNLLEASWLVRRERDGTAKRLYLDAGPLQVVPRWIATFRKRG
jgi:DNA-binding transcriptional ArsR family regulator